MPMNATTLTQKGINQLFVLLLLLNMLDAATTTYLVSMGGIDIEVNPYMKWVIINFGYIGMVAAKSLVIGGFYAIYAFGVGYGPTRTLISIRRGLILTCGVYTILCIHNTILMGMVVQTTL
jgi:hypothetical protein